MSTQIKENGEKKARDFGVIRLSHPPIAVIAMSNQLFLSYNFFSELQL
jgi:hypothetical protein